jgi:hypothetical protein
MLMLAQATIAVALVALTVAAQALLVAAVSVGISVTLLVIIKKRRQQQQPAVPEVYHHVHVAHCTNNQRRQWRQV